MTNEVKCWCQHCGQELEPSHTGNCPYCGKIGKKCEATATVAIGITVSASAEGTRVFFIWFNKKVGLTTGFIVIDIAFLLLSTVVGYVVGIFGQLFGALAGFVVGLIIIILYDLRLRNKIENTKRKVIARL